MENNSTRSRVVKAAQQSITCLGSALTTIGITSLIATGVFHINSELLEAILLYAGAAAVVAGSLILCYGCVINVCPKTTTRIPNNNNNAITVV